MTGLFAGAVAILVFTTLVLAIEDLTQWVDPLIVRVLQLFCSSHVSTYKRAQWGRIQRQISIRERRPDL